MSIIDQDEYVTRHWSPILLSAIHPTLEPSEDFLLENSLSDVDEDLDVDNAWHPALRSEHNCITPRPPKDVATEIPKWKPSRKDYLLLSMMNGGRLSDDVEKSALLEALPEDFNPPAQDTNVRRSRRQRRRFILPLDIHGQVVSTCPDSGSDANIMSLRTAQELGLVPHIMSMSQRFTLANGAEVQSLFQVTARCSFTRSYAWQQPEECVFHIFSTLAVPVIMGMGFLSSAQVFTTRRSELIVEEVTSAELLSVNFLGSPRNSLVCRLQTQVACAMIDSGSDLNLVSAEFAKKLVDVVVPNHEKLQLADGSFDFTAGLINIDFSIGAVDEACRFLARSGEERLDFHVLESLGTDVLIGLDTIEDFAVFQNHTESLIPNISHSGVGNTSILRHVGRVENWIVEQFRTLRAGSARRSNNMEGTSENLDVQQQRENSRRERDNLDPVDPSTLIRSRGNLSDVASQPSNISSLPLFRPPSSFFGSSEASRSSTPETNEASTPLSSSHCIDGLTNPEATYRCTVKGCYAAPFPTQYLLKSHANVHSMARPHFCPVRGCPRSEGGKGFKRKNEMIRHGLVHDSPGYYCPFCPDQQRKYPRPDILQRHVRVHHVDKDRNNPLLREVLSRRPDWPNTR